MSLSISEDTWKVIKTLVPEDETLLMTMNRLARGNYSVDPWWDIMHARYREAGSYPANEERIAKERLERQKAVEKAYSELRSSIRNELTLKNVDNLENRAKMDGCVFCTDPDAERRGRILIAGYQDPYLTSIFPFMIFYPPVIAFNARVCETCYSNAPGNLSALPEIKKPSIERDLQWLRDETAEKTTKNMLELLKSKDISRALPYTDGSVLDVVGKYVVDKEPIKAVLQWGAGRKKNANWADETTFDTLRKVRDKVQKVYSPGLELQILCTDTHGVFNWAEPDDVLSYETDIRKLSKESGFTFSTTSRRIWLKYGICGDEIERACKSKDELSDKGGRWFEYVPCKDVYVSQAKKNSRPYGDKDMSDSTSKRVAEEYYIMRQLEKKPLEIEFEGHLLLMFSDPQTRDVLPELPTAYLWSLKRGSSDMPWLTMGTREEYVDRRRSG